MTVVAVSACQPGSAGRRLGLPCAAGADTCERVRQAAGLQKRGVHSADLAGSCEGGVGRYGGRLWLCE